MTDRSQMLAQALDLAEHLRPGAAAHRMWVAALVLDRTSDEELAVAAVLHDAADGAIDDEIVRRVEAAFGSRVAHVVAVCSENGAHPEPPFRGLDEARIAELYCANRDVLVVAAADALGAVRSTLARGVDTVGSSAVVDSYEWFWTELASVLDDRLRGWSLARDLRGAVAEFSRAALAPSSHEHLPVAG